MKRIARTDNWIKRIKRSGQRFRREGRRICSVFLCASLVVGNCTVTPFSAFAEDESGEYEYEFERASFKAAIREAVEEGALDQDLNLIGTYAEEYADLLESDGSLYEVFPETIDEDRDRDRALDLRIFARIEGSIPVDDTYVFDGSEELIFLLENKTNQIQTAAIGIDGMWTDEIDVLPATSVAVDGESGGPGVVAGAVTAETDAAVAGDAVISGDSAISGGSMSGSGGSSGGSGGSGSLSGGSGSGSSVSTNKPESADETVPGSESDLTEEYADGLNHEVTVDDSDPDKTESDDLDSIGESQGTEGDHLDGDPADITDGQKSEDDTNGSVTDGIDDTTEAGSGTSGANADADAGKSGEDDDELDAGDTTGEEVESGSGNNSEEAGETSDEDDEISDDGDNTDTGSDETDDSDGDTAEDSSSDTSSEDSSGSDTGDTAGGSEEDASGNDNTSGQTASISLHRTAYLSASLATDSNVEKRATPSDASASDAEHSIDGELLNAVLLDGHGAVAFVTTAADCKLDVIMLSEQEMTCESEDGDQDYLVTVTGWLPDGGFVTAEPVDVEIEGKTVLLALDISIYDDNGELYEPAEDTISVKITSSEIASEETGANYDVYYVPEEGEPELVPVTESEDGEVTFEAEHFSVYVVTEMDSVYATGKIANAAGEADAITWTIYQDESGTKTLVFSGTGGIPDYSTGLETPWYSYTYTSPGVHVVIEDGITRIGNYAFRNNYVMSLEIGSDVESIGSYVFWYVHGLSEVTIPGNVKTIESSAFYVCYDLASVTLEEGVESIGMFAFGYSGQDASYTVYLPSSIREIKGGAFINASSYAFLDGSDSNGYYRVVDGVLYTDDMQTLADYPARRLADCYTVPDTVTNVQSRAFEFTTNTKQIIVSGSVKTWGGNSVGAYEFAQSPGLESVIFEDGANASGNNMFESCSNLISVTLPEEYSGLALRQAYFNGCTNVESITIPSGTTSIYGLNTGTMTSLQTVVYNAADATLGNNYTYNYVFYNSAIYDLIIGTDVDVLRTNFDYIVEYAGSITFQGENFITIEDGALASAPSPLTGLTGTFYVDTSGALYQIDEKTGTASLVYVPANMIDSESNSQPLTELTVPTEITAEDGETIYKVTGIGSYAFRNAENLTTLTFADTSVITVIEDYAMANCPLECVIDAAMSQNAETEEDAIKLFTGVTSDNMGYQPFYCTNLGGASGTGTTAADMDGDQSIVITHEDNVNAKLTINVEGGTWEYATTETEDGETVTSETAGGYTLDTGRTLTINVTAQAPSATDVYTFRVYLSYTDSDYTKDYIAGKTYTFELADGSTIEAVCHATEDPNTIYFEFVVATGSTKSFALTTSYPNVITDGGGLTIWGEVLDSEEAETEGTSDNEGKQTIQVWWVYEPDTYEVTKTNTSDQTKIALARSEDQIRFAASLNYTIQTSLVGDTQTYGRDYVTSVSYEDILTLPDGVEWDESVLEAIQSGMIYYGSNVLYIRDAEGNKTELIKVTVDAGSAVSLTGVRLKLTNETEARVVLCWTLRNTSGSSLDGNTVKINIYPAATVITNVDAINGEEAAVLHNEVTGTFHYTYSSDQSDSGEVDKTINVENGTINLTKTASSATYFGEDVTYTLTVYNGKGLPYTASSNGVYTLVDMLDVETYISAAGMEEMFADAAEMGLPLTITIEGAVLGVSDTASDTSGRETVSLNSGNTSSENESTVTLVITAEAVSNGDGESISASYTVSYGENEETGSELAEILQKLGYGVTSSAIYTCTWELGGDENTPYTLAGGASLEFVIPATLKNTFQLMNEKDWPNRYASASATAVNNAYIYLSGQKNAVKSASATTEAYREAYISKSAYQDGELLSSSPSAENDSVLEYKLSFQHIGSGEYEDLPMVDDLYGSQLLLVPADSNPGLEDTCDTYVYAETDEDGNEKYVTYYILGIGEYANIVVGQDADGNDLVAASITVTMAENETEVEMANGGTYSYTGYHTQIKWYYKNLDGGRYTLEVTYKALVQYGDTVSYAIGNIVWMNDRIGSRIYDTLWGGGTLIDFDKAIVVGSGDTNESKIDIINNASGAEEKDGLDDDDYSTISQGESVTYCLTLSGHSGGTFTLTGDNLADLLPDTGNIFEWVKGKNVVLTYDYDSSIEISGIDLLSDWYIGDTYGGAAGTYIRWSDELSITFHGDSAFKIYVTLTFPSNSDTEGEAAENTSLWTEYADAIGGTTLSNTLYVYSFTSAVTHELVQGGQVLLQKGVYGEAEEVNDGSMGMSFVPMDTDLNLFHNEDSYYRYVVYYTALYNGGNTRLYLNDLVDTLPDGYSILLMVGSTDDLLNGGTYLNNSTRYTVTVSGSTSEDDLLISGLPDGTIYRSAAVSRTVQDGNTVIFTVNGTSDEDSIHYDADREMYYLAKNEALVFGYVCSVGAEEETGTEAVNTISMDYYDYLQGGVEQIAEDDSDYAVTGQNLTYQGSTYYDTSDNDGNREVVDDEETGIQTLTSTVTQKLGEIVPGIEKSAESYTDSSGNTTAYTTSVYGGSGETINWKATLRNTGTRSIRNYTVTDTMPAPYVFEGDVTMNICSGSGTWLYTTANTLFTISERSADDNTVMLTSGIVSYTLEIGGDPVTVTYSKHDMEVSIDKDEDENEVLTIVFEDAYFAIPEGGYLELGYSSRNPSTNITYITYVNQVTLTPTQEFSSKGEGVLVGDYEAVMANAMITVAGAYGTTSSKSVVELESVKDKNTEVETLEETDNSAISTSMDNSIVLTGVDSIFRYTLTVNNVTSKAMTKLVLIDTLPEKGDTYAVGSDARGSDFTVNLAEDPKFEVSVKTESADGSGSMVTRVLENSEYTIEYSTDTNITSADYAGSSDSKWHSNLAADNDRSVRIIINDADGARIPSGATVEVRFNAVADTSGEIDPSAIAWNNFGYHYGLYGLEGTELTAMPKVVGVQLPSAPSLTKELVDLNGDAYHASEDMSFTFVVYEGSELTDTDTDTGEIVAYDTEEALVEALIGLTGEEARAYRIVTLTVKKGESSATLKLTGTNGLKEDSSESWLTWLQGEIYTITEFLSDGYSLKSWSETGGTSTDKGNGNSFTFTYDRTKTLCLTCENNCEIWELTLTKVDAADNETTLQGAVFALYSQTEPNEPFASSYGANPTILVDGVDWYLCGEGKTETDGTYTWSGLTEDSYYLVEIKAPDGYNLNTEPIEVRRTNNEQSITVTNEAGSELPETGGPGTLPFRVAGLLLMSVSAYLIYDTFRRRRISAS